ncbi:MAG: saccharopine dehydrogenase NADP-binding domain-containing protein [Polyangiaceae bacterium]|nr:saccharopine dehydrogenase NADP-binding domain-containing protein [Polyangiaceae bacterium]
MSSDRPFDIIVFGATGFTGRLTAEYLAQRGPSPLRWAIAGRNLEKLAEIKAALEALSPSAASAGVVEARSDDPASLARMAASTRVVLTTVGPYAQHGEPLVEACIQERTDYVDITGEPDFVERLLRRHHAAAADRGVRIVNCCGFDSVPHDLGALFTVTKLPQGEPITLEAYVRAGGTFSGGTWHSALNAVAHLRDRLRPLREPDPPGRTIRSIRPRIRYDRELHAWLCPLPTIDPQIVLRSARALDAYGPEFRYGHYAQIRSGLRLAAGLAGIGAIVALAQLGPTRDLLGRIRAQGEGPTPEQRARGWFQVTFHGKAASRRVVTRVSGGDPGYSETAKMVAESALCLALDRERLPARAGVLTPAVAMGDHLTDRLQQAGIRFELLEG